jgi:IS4 transposase
MILPPAKPQRPPLRELPPEEPVSLPFSLLPPAPRSAWELFQQLLPPRLLNDLDPKAAQTAYTPWVVTWLLVFQRLNGNATLNDAVSEFLLRFPPEARPDCKRVREGTLSANSGAYSAARSHLDGRVLYWAAEHVFDSLVASYPPCWRGRRAFSVDGSTLPLAPTLELQAAFPPASNQHGPSHWPILHLATAHELSSGLAVWPEYGPMYGPQAVGEIALARGLLGRLPAGSILLADRNFGIFAFAYAAVQARHAALLRLKQDRFAALRRQAQEVGPGQWALAWRPSRSDRQAHPELPEEAQVQGWLYEVRVSERLTLWLFSTEDGTPEEMASLYRRRLNVETDIKDLKITLKLDQVSGKSVAMVEKELLAALLAYNLANQVRRLAAQLLHLEPRALSFAGVWSLLKAFTAKLLHVQTAAEAEADFERLLRAAGQRKLPRRPQGRSYPREVIPRRRKFPTRKRSQNQVPQ